MRFHTYYFNRATTARMLAECGFVPLDFHQPVKTWTLGYLAHKLRAYGDGFGYVEKLFRALRVANIPLHINPRDIIGVIARKD